MAIQMEAPGLPGDGYRSTTPLEGMEEYLNLALRPVFDLRRRKERPAVPLRRNR